MVFFLARTNEGSAPSNDSNFLGWGGAFLPIMVSLFGSQEWDGVENNRLLFVYRDDSCACVNVIKVVEEKIYPRVLVLYFLEATTGSWKEKPTTIRSTRNRNYFASRNMIFAPLFLLPSHTT